MVKYGIDTELFVGDNVIRPVHDFYNGIKVHRFPLKTIRVLDLMYRFVSPSFLLSLNKYKPDVIHCLCYRHFTTDLSILYSKIKHVPIMISVHGLGHNPTRLFQKFLTLYDYTIGQIMLRLVKKIIAYPFKDALEKPITRFIDKVTFISPAIDYQKFKSKTDIEEIKEQYGLQDKFVLLNVGRETIDDVKGQRFLTKAFTKMNIPNSKLLIAGTNQVKQERNIIKLGFIPQNVLGSLYETANVFVQTSKFETASRVLMEALCFGLPIISTKVGIAPYIINNENGFLVDHDDYQGFKIAVQKIRSGTIKRSSGTKYIELFDWNKIVTEFIQVYNDLLEE